MNLKRFLTQEKEIGGIKISDAKISIAYLKSASGSSGNEIIIDKWAEIDIQPGVIENGEIKNKELFFSDLKKLSDDLFSSKKGKLFKFKKTAKNLPVIISIPAQKAYVQVFSLPGTIPYDQLEETMELTVGFSLPLSISQSYLDWELINAVKKDTKEILLVLVKKEIINSYLDVFKETEFIPIACELYSSSLNRIVSRFNMDEKPFCSVLITQEGAEIIVSKLKNIRFVRSIYWRDSCYFRENNLLNLEIKKKILSDEIWRVLNFDETQKNGSPVEKIYLMGNLAETSSFKESIEKSTGKKVIIFDNPYKISNEIAQKLSEEKKKNLIEDTSNLIVFGAALRGFISRRQDVEVSLLPVGTEERYSQAKTMSFLNFITVWVAAISLFFIAVFCWAYFTISFLQKEADKSIQLKNIPLSQEMQEIKEKAAEFNKNLNFMASLSRDKNDWIGFLSELKIRKTEGIIYSRIAAESYEGIINLTGTAKTRDQLLVFKENLIKSELLEEIDLPIKFLEQKTNINFNITFKIKAGK